MPSKRRTRKGSGRKIAAAKVRRMAFLTRVEVYDQLAAMAGKDSLVGTFEELVEREFDRRMRRMGLMPYNSESSC